MSTKVVLVESYPQVIAGQQLEMLSLLSHSADAGVTPIVMVPAPGMFVDRLMDEGWNVRTIPYPESLTRYGGEIYRDGIGKRLFVLRDTVKYISLVRRELKSIRPAAIFHNDLRGLLTVGIAAKSLGIPNVIWDKLNKPHGILDWFQLPLVRHNPMISNPVAEKYPAWQRRWYRDRISVVPDGVDSNCFQSVAPIRDQLGYQESDVVFGIFGTVTHRKAHDVLLDAAAPILKSSENAKILVVGSWTDAEEDEAFQRTLNDRNLPGIQFLGRRDDIPRLMNSIDVLVIPSRMEGLGLVTLEAMACAKPVIGSRIGGIAEAVVDNETGLLFESENRDGLRQALQSMINDPAMRRQMGEAGRLRVQTHYNREEKMRTIWNLILDAAGRAPDPFFEELPC
ncbi:glycosyltransferase family 4 protein [Novipirellula rosea]|uniref:glycosyltransferase family 4 protein n=1 Tax=Novipirellula rosea TaxID=1031540 RepID=UPI0031EE5779